MKLFYSCLIDLINGFIDSLQIFNIFDIILNSEKILLNLRNCICLNGLILISSNIFFIYFIEPFFNYIGDLTPFGFFFSIGKYFYLIFWLIPIFLVCNIVTAFWIDEIYYESLEKVEKTTLINVEGINLTTAISNQIERLLIVLSFTSVLNLINIIINTFGNFSSLIVYSLMALKFFMMSITNSLYVFEYILMQKYLKNYKSILYFMENKLFYFFGFGILLTILTLMIESFTVYTGLFLIFFPLFLIASVKINHKRFSKEKEIQLGKLKFFYLNDLIYENLLLIIMKILKLNKK